MTKIKKKILLILKLPPPLTGATLMNGYVNNSLLIRENFDTKTIAIHYSKSVEDLGGFSFFKLLQIFKTYIKLKYQLVFFRPQIVYFQISPLGFAFIRDLLFVTIIKFFNKTIVYHIHGKGIKEAAQKKLWKILYQFAFKNEKVICLSNSLTKDIEDVYLGKPYIVPNAVLFNLKNIPLKKENEVVEILFLSNLFIAKGILVFIDSLEELMKRNISFKASIVGSEADINKKTINELLKKKGLQNLVFYLGPKYNEEKWNIYLKSDIFVFPTLNDIWGLVVLEAMQAGLPVIASKDGAIPEIIDDGETGFLIEKGNVHQLATKIELLIKDKEQRESMGINGRKKYIDLYNLDKFENNMTNVFNQIKKVENV